VPPSSNVFTTNFAELATYSSTGSLTCTFGLPLGRVYSHVSSFYLFPHSYSFGRQALLDTLNMRTSIRDQHHSNRPVNLTDIVDRDLGNLAESIEPSQSANSVRASSNFELDEHGWFVGHVYDS
jgi:hypothetical protein